MVKELTLHLSSCLSNDQYLQVPGSDRQQRLHRASHQAPDLHPGERSRRSRSCWQMALVQGGGEDFQRCLASYKVGTGEGPACSPAFLSSGRVHLPCSQAKHSLLRHSGGRGHLLLGFLCWIV